MKNREQGFNIRTFYKKLTEQLANAAIDHPQFEAKQLLACYYHTSPSEILLSDQSVDDKDQKRLLQLCQKRCEKYPLQYILGEWDFFGYQFFVGEGVLIPRADTEAVIELSLQLLQSLPNPKIIDLCSGSGCIPITLQKETHSNQVFALEHFEKAFSYLEKNIAYHGNQVMPLLDDAMNPVTNQNNFDLITCNPPYLNDQDMQKLQLEVREEPVTALHAKQNGYEFYQKLSSIWKQRLNIGGWLVYEVGIGQADQVAEILRGANYQKVSKWKDLNGIDRVVYGCK